MKVGAFTEARGAERMRQSADRAFAAMKARAITKEDLHILLAVHVETIGRSKIENTITHATIAYHVRRLVRVDNEDDLDPKEQRNREAAKDRIGDALKRLAAIGAIDYEAGKGGRFSVIGLPEVDDANPTHADGVGNIPNPTHADGVGKGQPHAATSPNPTPPHVPTPRSDVAQPHARAWGLQIETDGADRRRSGLVREIAQHVDRLAARLTACATVDDEANTLLSHTVATLALDYLDPAIIDDVLDARADIIDHPALILLALADTDDDDPQLAALLADRRFDAITDHLTAGTIAAITATHTGRPLVDHLDEAADLAAHWAKHNYPRHAITEALATTGDIRRPAHLDRHAQQALAGLDGTWPKFKAGPAR